MAGRSATRRVVRCSAYPVSGFACRSRRNSTSSASCEARNASRSAIRSRPSMSLPSMFSPVLCSLSEAVRGELSDQRLNHAGQLPRPPVHGVLPLVGGTVLKHLVGDRQLVGTAEPIGHRLARPPQLMKLVPLRRGRTLLVSDD